MITVPLEQVRSVYMRSVVGHNVSIGNPKLFSASGTGLKAHSCPSKHFATITVLNLSAFNLAQMTTPHPFPATSYELIAMGS